MQITIQVFDIDGNLIFDVPEDTTVQQIKTLAAEKLNLLDHVNDMTLIFNQRIILNDNTSILQLEYNTESKFVLFLPRFVRSNNENFNKSPYTIPQPKPNQTYRQSYQGENMSQMNNSNINQINNSRQMRYTPLGPDSPHHTILLKLSTNIQRVVNREQPYVNPWKCFLIENNTPLQDPLVQKNFEISSKLNEKQIYFICDSIYYKKVSLARALDVLANASYDPDIARNMI